MFYHSKNPLNIDNGLWDIRSNSNHAMSAISYSEPAILCEKNRGLWKKATGKSLKECTVFTTFHYCQSSTLGKRAILKGTWEYLFSLAVP